jgi:hypothetical protein
MALIDKTHLYDGLKAPFPGHALNDLLINKGGKWEAAGTMSFYSKEEYEALKFRDNTASEEMKEIDPWTGEAKNLYSYADIKDELPSWDEVWAEHEDNLAEYAAYEGKRARKYPDIKDQLDMLYKDIDKGLLGDTAKASAFYTTIKAVKDANQ